MCVCVCVCVCVYGGGGGGVEGRTELGSWGVGGVEGRSAAAAMTGVLLLLPLEKVGRSRDRVGGGWGGGGGCGERKKERKKKVLLRHVSPCLFMYGGCL